MVAFCDNGNVADEVGEFWGRASPCFKNEGREEVSGLVRSVGQV